MILDTSNCQTSRKSSKTNINASYKRDESDNLINKLFSVFKNHIKQLKNIITNKKEKLIYINSSSNYANSIVKNIIRHNYSFEHLKSLEDTIIQIKEQSIICNNYILEEEQNLKLFTEEFKNLLKSIDFYKMKYDENLNKKLNLTKNGKDLNLNHDFNHSLIDPFFLSKTRNIQKRTKSQGNRETIKNERNSNNISKSQRDMIDKNNSLNYFKSDSKFIKTKSVLNDNRNIKYLKIKKNNLGKAQSTYNIEIDKNNSINNYSNNFSELNILNYHSLLSKYEEIQKQNEEYKKCHKYLNKQILNYKNIINLLNKQNNNKGIMEKEKEISILNCEVQNLKRQLENRNSKSIVDFHKKNKNLNLKYFDTDNMDTYESDANNNTGLSSHSLKKNGGNYSLLKRENETKLLKTDTKLKPENLLLKMKINYKDKILDKEANCMITNLKNKIKKYEMEINNLKEKLKNEIEQNEELNNFSQNQKIKYEYEISKINDKRSELSKLLFKKNNEIIKLQKDLFSKTKELEKGKNKLDKMKPYYEKIINEKDEKQFKLNACISLLKEENELLQGQNEKNKNEIKELNDTIIQYEKQLYQKNEEISKIQIDKINDMKKLQNKDNTIEINKLKEEIEKLKETIKNDNSEETINKLKEENEGLKQFFFKMKDKEERIVEDNTDLKEKVSSLKKENDIFKAYFNDKKVSLTSLSEYNKNMKRNVENKNVNLNDVLIELNNAKKEINILKKKNEDLFKELESKKFDNDYCDHFSENKAISNYEEEFDLRKMAKGAKDKNRSQDINIDYPGAQQVKDKFRELDYYYNSLEELVKKLLLNLTCTNKNRAYISELCKIVGFNDEVINKILNNKSKKGLLEKLV